MLKTGEWFKIFLTAISIFLTSCLSSPIVVKPRLYQPSQLPTTLDKAKKEWQKGNLATALVLLANHEEASQEKQILIDQIVKKLQDELEHTQDIMQKADLSRTLSLFTKTKAIEPDYQWPYEPQIKSITSSEEWVKGTATIIVDRGMKIEKGRGTFDVMAGSGFFISQDGYLVTNYHVIESVVNPEYKGYAKLTIRLPHSRGEKLPAKVVGWDKSHDLALLKIEYQPEFFFTFSQSDQDIRPGTKVFALGSPGGLDSTITQGIISARKPAFPQMPVLGEVIQVDAPINHGNSGGPLVNEEGKVVGVVFAGIEFYEGINFGIPSSTVVKLLPRMKESEKLILSWLGLGLIEDLQGLEVTYVLPESPSDWAGLKVGDRLIYFEGISVKHIVTIQEKLLTWGTKGTVQLGIERDGKLRTLLCGLAPRPDEPIRKAFESDLKGNLLPLLFGIIVEGIGSPVDSNFRISKVYSGSIADELDLALNDPFSVLRIFLDKERKLLMVSVYFKRRQGGNLESVIDIPFLLIGQQMI